MLFRRRASPSAFRRLARSLWPERGWRRSFHYFSHRLRRLPGTPYVIAAGFASGAAVSMLPLPGLHFLLGALLAWCLRASILASMIGTIVGNPWTFPLIWIWTFRCGNWILGNRGEESVRTLSLSHVLENPFDILMPMMIGAIPTAVLVWGISYLLVSRIVASYQNLRQLRRLRASRRALPVGEEGS